MTRNNGRHATSSKPTACRISTHPSVARRRRHHRSGFHKCLQAEMRTLRDLYAADYQQAAPHLARHVHRRI
jgi:hypothetical protein